MTGDRGASEHLLTNTPSFLSRIFNLLWVDVRDDDDRDEFFGLSQDFQMLSTHKRDSGDDNDDVSYEEVGDQHWRAGLGQQVETFYIGSKCVTRLGTLFIEVSLGNILTPRLQRTKPG